MLGIITILLLFMWGLFIFGFVVENEYILYIGSAGLILFSVYMMLNGLEGTNNFVIKGLAVIQIGLGFMGILAPVIETLNNN